MGSYVTILLVAIGAVLQRSGLAAGDDHIVGANHGWQVPAEAGGELNYSEWAAQETFYLGDFISFHYEKARHTVYEVNRTVYDSCDFGDAASSEGRLAEPTMLQDADSSSVLRNWSTKGGRSVVPLNESRVYYFACAVAQHCLQGMKVAVSVLPTARPTSAGNPILHASSASTLITSPLLSSYQITLPLFPLPFVLFPSPLSLSVTLFLAHAQTLDTLL